MTSKEAPASRLAATRDELQRRINELESDNKRLVEKNQEFARNNLKLKQLANIPEKWKEYNKEHFALQAAIVQEQNNELKTKLEQADNDIVYLTKEKLELELLIRSRNDDIENKTKTISELNGKLQKSEKAKVDADSRCDSIRMTLQKQLDTIKNELEDTKTKNQEYLKQVQDIEKKWKDERDRKRVLEGDVKKRSDEISKFAEENKTLRESLRDAKEPLINQVKELDEKLSQIKVEKIKLEKNLENEKTISASEAKKAEQLLLDKNKAIDGWNSCKEREKKMEDEITLLRKTISLNANKPIEATGLYEALQEKKKREVSDLSEALQEEEKKKQDEMIRKSEEWENLKRLTNVQKKELKVLTDKVKMLTDKVKVLTDKVTELKRKLQETKGGLWKTVKEFIGLS